MNKNFILISALIISTGISSCFAATIVKNVNSVKDLQSVVHAMILKTSGYTIEPSKQLFTEINAALETFKDDKWVKGRTKSIKDAVAVYLQEHPEFKPQTEPAPKPGTGTGTPPPPPPPPPAPTTGASTPPPPPPMPPASQPPVHPAGHAPRPQRPVQTVPGEGLMDELQARLRARREAAGGATTAEQREGAAAEIARLRRQAEETRHDIRRQENLRNAAATEADRMLRQLTQLKAQQYIVVTDLDHIDRALNRVRGSLEQLIDLPDFASTPIRQRQTDVTNLSQRTAALKTRFERLTLQQQQTEARTFIGEIERIINEIKTMVESPKILVERPE